MPDQPSVEVRFARIAKELSGLAGVTVGSGKRGFGSNALLIDGRIFAMVSHGRLVLKLPEKRVKALLERGDAAPFDAGKGKPMKEWAAIAPRTKQWLALAREALQFVGSRSN